MAALKNPRKGWTPEDYWAEQLWDSDCNNCKHVVRVLFDRTIELPHVFGSPARCSLFDRKVRCFGPGLFSAHPCFVHIRTGEASPHTNVVNEQRRFWD